MSNCLEGSKVIKFNPAAVAFGCFRWSLASNSHRLLPNRLIILDAEALWDDFIVKARFDQLLRPFAALSDCILYVSNWKRAANRHTAQLNRLFRQAVMQDTNSTPSKQPPLLSTSAAELENELFLHAIDSGVKINFSTATSEAQNLTDLMDFVLEMTRIVGKTAWDRSNKHKNVSENGQLTLPPDTKIKSGKDAPDCWLRMLCQIPRITPPVADAIVKNFPTFKSLMRAVNACDCDEDGQELLADVRLHEGEGKRIGPSLALRVYRHFKW